MESNSASPSPTPTGLGRSPVTASAAWTLSLGTVAVVASAIYLFMTNTSVAHWDQGYNPLGTWWLSTIVAGLPIVVLLGAMAILRVKAHIAAVAGLATALLVAILTFHMPVRLALTAATYGGGCPVCS